jgi:hypothetical protein
MAPLPVAIANAALSIFAERIVVWSAKIEADPGETIDWIGDEGNDVDEIREIDSIEVEDLERALFIETVVLPTYVALVVWLKLAFEPVVVVFANVVLVDVTFVEWDTVDLDVVVLEPVGLDVLVDVGDESHNNEFEGPGGALDPLHSPKEFWINCITLAEKGRSPASWFSASVPPPPWFEALYEFGKQPEAPTGHWYAACTAQSFATIALNTDE